jgi:hypothetical protein
MAAMWLSGFEEDPDDAGELCVVEVFGSSVKPDGTAEIDDEHLVPELVVDWVGEQS